MERVPNQKRIEIIKEKGDQQNLYTKNTIAAIDEAAHRLQSKCGFKLYMYFAKNMDGYSFNLSSSDFTKWAGVSLQAYNTAIQELIEHRYLVKKADGSKNNYIFYDIPQEQPQDLNVEISLNVEIRKSSTDTDIGFVF